MARNMSNGRQVGRPAQGNNSGFKEDPTWAPKPQPGPPVVSSGSQSKPKGTGRWNPKAEATPGTINRVGPAV